MRACLSRRIYKPKSSETGCVRQYRAPLTCARRTFCLMWTKSWGGLLSREDLTPRSCMEKRGGAELACCKQTDKSLLFDDELVAVSRPTFSPASGYRKVVWSCCNKPCCTFFVCKMLLQLVKAQGCDFG